ncbi:MAG TPA: ABC transporter substrate-binding protein [Candidatus Angelobacter sp.]|nr:ABC transporter substrate-binding protein [Candidatus Angelobacter sp.]
MATVAGASRSRRGGRRLGLTYAGLSALLVLALLPALHPPRPPLPPVAAFAPVAQQNITKPPPDQASTAGKGANQNGNGEAGGGSATPTPAPTPTPLANSNGLGAASNQGGTSVPRTLDCVDGPGGPRQIEDTQSPPCVPYWKGDNGGSTWKGVDANTIRIGLGEGQNATDLWNKFFNDRFQLYGRQIELVPVKCGGDSDSPQATMVQRADTVAAEANVFAVLGCPDAGGREKYFFDELARNRIVSVTARPDLRSSADYQRAAPYEWNYYPPYDVDEHNMAAQACRLRDQPPPAYAAPTVLQGKRKFGIVYTSYPDSASIDLHYLLDDLTACGITIAPKDTLGVDYVPASSGVGYQNRSSTSTQQAQQAVAQLDTDGITTVLFISHAASTLQVLQQADTAGYHPEWMMGYFSYNTGWGSGLQPSDQWNHAFGFDYENKLVAAPNNPWYWAVMQEDPSYPWPYAPASYNGWFGYEMELMLVSGLQMAGPHLTPQTFQAGLWKTHFPNPPSAYFEGTVGFDTDYTFMKDRAMVWYSATTTGPWGQQGVWCYVNHGRRVTDATVPAGYPYFSGSCEA